MTMSLVCTSTNTISKQEHMATPSLNDQPFIDTTLYVLILNKAEFYRPKTTAPQPKLRCIEFNSWLSSPCIIFRASILYQLSVLLR
jgi:hypothetical protein